MSRNGSGEASGHGNIESKWDENKIVDRGVLGTSKSPPTPQNMTIDTTNPPRIAYPQVRSPSIVPQAKAIITPSAKEMAVSEAIDAIEELTSDFEAVTDESNTEEIPSELTPKGTKRRKTQIPKLKSAAGPSRKREWPRTGSVNDNSDNNNPGRLPSEDAYENSPASSLWTDDESWDTPSYLRYDPERPVLYRSVPPRKTMRQRVASLKHKVVKIARTDMDWVKGAMASIRIKAGVECPRLRVNSTENLHGCSKDSSNLSLRGGAGDISSLNDGGNDLFGFGGGSETCVSVYAHIFTQWRVHLMTYL